MFAIRDERDYIVQDDLNKACVCPIDAHAHRCSVRKLQEAKKRACLALRCAELIRADESKMDFDAK